MLELNLTHSTNLSVDASYRISSNSLQWIRRWNMCL